ncbi:peptidoglycan DD-metalloendopeptidase family protein [Pigmentiphaga sp.]|uniref:peptidoglycan DD-metalloendopeptidase family protein n=1 Tax=Pigmentiphaga sp. TaxID=1977564 RepID=UPI00128B4F7F|nr:peptidoglycan DD-metalloendopeptidase family protein [Pigmentiphaga sp.]MPS26087.1 LysM peptidoglycan-binding domain-containing protein [Alcaligenaceae bacterium SAGV5]MPT57593.1 LysM peptidoglycan-binding domain-containing protein [Alcaligenaceae bacterium]
MQNWRKPNRDESNRPRLGAERLGRTARRVLLWTSCALVLAACGTTPRTVPVVDRTTPAKPPSGPAATAGRESSRLIDADTYVVKRGDTLIRIALDHGEDWRDIAQWNNLEDPNQIRPGQVLRVTRPGSTAARPADSGVAQATPVPAPSQSASRPLGTPAPEPASPAPAPAVPAPAPATQPTAPATPPARSEPAGERVEWGWPASGKIIENFHETRNKGLDIAGTPGDPVLAAGDGKVVYSGSGLRGYGQLIIIKHNNTFLSAYAHNRAMLVKEGQAVRRGQKIAELGSTDAESPRVHFEIRRQGRPVDPAGYLPPR